MGAFQYSALDSDGRTHKGVVDGDTRREARERLRARGLTPFDLRDASRPVGPRWSGAVNPATRALFSRQLHSLVRAGVRIEDALKTMARRPPSRRQRVIVNALLERVRAGRSLADALRASPEMFDAAYCASVAAGERSGRIETVLEQLADNAAREHEQRQQLLVALLYPAVLVSVGLLIVAGLVAYVLPQILIVFGDAGRELPLLTRVMLRLSEHAGGLVLAVLVMVTAGALLWRGLARRAGPVLLVHRLGLALPVVGAFLLASGTARFVRTLSVLAGSRVPMVEALTISARVVQILPLRHALENMALEMEDGRSLTSAMERSGQFSPVMLQLVASGEAGGRIEEMLEFAARFQEKELATRAALLLGLVEPLLILLMGGFVVAVVFAILLPVYELNSLAG